jgi:hypothetical protein
MEETAMTIPFSSRSLFFAVTALAAAACNGDKGKQPTYCESICDLAVECAAAQREIDADAMMDECLAATKAAGECGEMNIAEEKAAKPCVDALAEAQEAGECDAFTGNSATATTDVGPASCLTQGGFTGAWSAAQEATAESGAEMCERFTSTFCDKITECVNSTAGYDPATFETTPYDVCMTSFQGRIDECASEGTYEVSGSVNVQRDLVNDCLSDVGNELTCEDLFAGRLPGTCAGAFVDEEQAASYGTSLAELGAGFASGR